jgi:glutamate N-acetyltransferase/amino-acid N-acetyltransferase
MTTATPDPAALEVIAGGVTTPRGFRAAGVHAGIKANGLDLALIVSDEAAAAAAVFTTNKAQAAPVLVSREHLDRSGGAARAIVVNSGCANACTGEAGIEVARDMTRATASLVGCADERVLGRLDRRDRRVAGRCKDPACAA